MKKADAITWLRSKVGKGYVYGAAGQVCTQALLDELEQRWGPGHKYEEAKKWIGVEVYDCVNLLKDCRRELDGVWEDVSADGLYQLSKPKTLQSYVVGDLLFRVKNGKAEHVGMVVSNRQVIEARSTARGVVISEITGKDWTTAARNPWIDYIDPVVKKAYAEGILSAQDLWQDYLDGVTPVNPAYLRILMDNYNARLAK